MRISDWSSDVCSSDLCLMMNPFCASVGFDAFIALRSIPSQVKMTPKTLTHFEGVSGRQIRNADCKHSNRASIYRNYTGPLLDSFALFIKNGIGSTTSQGSLPRQEIGCEACCVTRCKTV